MKRPTIKNIAAFLNQTLRIRQIADASMNGLQVRSANSGAISTVGFAVDGCISTFEKGKRRGADLLVVHHGIKWRPQRDRPLERLRADYLTRAGMALYAAHLPLDLHPQHGNNVQLAQMLGLHTVRRFGRYHGIKIGCAGTLPKARSVSGIAAILAERLGTACRVADFGRNQVRTIGIVSGGGGDMLREAVAAGLDALLVGELGLAVYNAAREMRMNIIAAGHYATETVGVRALMPVVEREFAVRTVFIDDPKDL